MEISRETFHQLVENKLCQAGLKREHAAIMTEVLVYADARGIHSHGTVRAGYYAERISKGGANHEPEFRLEETGPCSVILYAGNVAGQVAAKVGMEHTIKTAEQNGVAVVGISRMGHSSTVPYSIQQAVRARLIDISMYRSDPMVMPFGDAEIYYGTNPLAFATSGEGDEVLTFDMATIIQAWGKVLNARSRSMSIPDVWAVDKNGAPTIDPSTVHALPPAARSRGCGLMMMTDVLSDVSFNLSFG